MQLPCLVLMPVARKMVLALGLNRPEYKTHASENACVHAHAHSGLVRMQGAIRAVACDSLDAHALVGPQDTDSLVRDTASEAAARVARGLWERAGSAAATEAQSGSTNPIGRMLLDCLADGKRELQAAACGALGQARVAACGLTTHGS